MRYRGKKCLFCSVISFCYFTFVINRLKLQSCAAGVLSQRGLQEGLNETVRFVGKQVILNQVIRQDYEATSVSLVPPAG